MFGTGAVLPFCQQVVLLSTESFVCRQLEVLISHFLHQCFLSLFLPQLSQASSGCLSYLTMNLSSSFLLPPLVLTNARLYLLLSTSLDP